MKIVERIYKIMTMRPENKVFSTRPLDLYVLTQSRETFAFVESLSNAMELWTPHRLFSNTLYLNNGILVKIMT